jgi:hypothetical protein
MLINFLKEIKSNRRKQGQKYETDKVLLLSILAISSGAISYRKIHQYISLKFPTLKKMFNLKWKKPPVYNAIRYILVNIDRLCQQILCLPHFFIILTPQTSQKTSG